MWGEAASSGVRLGRDFGGGSGRGGAWTWQEEAGLEWWGVGCSEVLCGEVWSCGVLHGDECGGVW